MTRTASSVPAQGSAAGSWMARLMLPSAVMTPLSTWGLSQRTCAMSLVSIQKVSAAARA